MEPKLSVIIPAYSTVEFVMAHVAACLASSRKPDEIIVVDDHSPHTGLVDALRRQRAQANGAALLYARVGRSIDWNQPGARNLGVWISTGDLLSFEDVDHLPDPLYYEAALAILTAPNPVAFRAARDIVDKAGTLHQLKPPMGVFVCKRWAFCAAGGWDEDFSGHYGHDDSIMHERLARQGEIIIGEKPLLHVNDAAGTRAPHLQRDVNHNTRLYRKRQKRAQVGGPLIRFPYTMERL